MEIEVQHYQKQWPILFEIEKSNIEAIISEEVIKIHHIGSTAVENLKAKPIIDMLVVVNKGSILNRTDIKISPVF
ncbi:GrpB family protein [Staphylococcus shinii]|uniref:GrpB family protein n=1 Tax=Staphylococcus shinii TaxID=2912228 RepID=UPI003CF300C0